MLALQGRYKDATFLTSKMIYFLGHSNVYEDFYVTLIRPSTTSTRDASKLSSVTSGFDDSSKIRCFRGSGGRK